MPEQQVAIDVDVVGKLDIVVGALPLIALVGADRGAAVSVGLIEDVSIVLSSRSFRGLFACFRFAADSGISFADVYR